MTTRTARLIVRPSAALASHDLRGRWREEWLAEIDAVTRRDGRRSRATGRRVLVRSLGAPWDALMTRRPRPRAAGEPSGTVWRGWRSDLTQAIRLLVRAPGQTITTVVVVSRSFWRTRFGGADEAVGRTIVVGDRALEVIGVAPEQFSGWAEADIERGRSGIQLWLPLSEVRGWPGLPAPTSSRRVGYDVLVCASCGGRMRLLALIEQTSLIARILTHLGLPTEVPAAPPSRAPPLPSGTASRWADDDLPAA